MALPGGSALWACLETSEKSKNRFLTIGPHNQLAQGNRRLPFLLIGPGSTGRGGPIKHGAPEPHSASPFLAFVRAPSSRLLIL